MKKNLLVYGYFLLLFSVFTACRKTEDVAVPGNTAPPDKTISNSIKENYINRIYISVLGRKPDATELSQAKTVLAQNNLSNTDRKQFIDIVLNKPGYNERLYEIAKTDLLNALDTTEITQTIAVFQFFLKDSTYKNFWPRFQYEITRLIALRNVPKNLASGSMGIIDVHSTCVNNYFYDQINMGTENFVVSMFQNFLFRYPTKNELSESSRMVDDNNAIVFLKTGKNKTEFMNIFFSSSSYFEGQVRSIYLRFLFREPSSEEMSAKTTAYKTTLDYKALQKDILSSNEFLGI